MQSGLKSRYLLIALAVLVCAQAHAAKVVLRIEATNPRNVPQTREIRSNLPAGVGTNAIIDLDGMNLDYNLQKDIYQVYRNVELGPKETRTFRVEIRDIWRISEDKLDSLDQHAGSLAASLEDTDYAETAENLHQSVQETIEAIREEQKKNSIASGTRPVAHIAAYDANLEKLTSVKQDLAHLENLVLGAGKDPGRIVDPAGDRPAGAGTAAPRVGPEDYNTAIIELTVRNSSPNETRQIEVRHPLPEEIGVNDVLDADGLEVAPDFKEGITYLVSDGLRLEPQESRTFTVRIRDKWNVNEPRIRSLEERVSGIRQRISAGESFPAVETALDEIKASLGRIRAREGPQELNERYVEFYRRQSRQIAALEKKLERIESALEPAAGGQKLGFPVPAPSMKTTWLIIYIILGFLAVVSILFFLRWFSKSQAERVITEPPAETGAEEGKEEE
jgi:hypothetical protein